MKNILKLFVFIIMTFSFIVYTSNYNNVCADIVAPVKRPQASYTNVSPIDVVNNPDKYLNKNITITAEFVAFTSLGLDYKPAFRDGTKYIGILIKRPDVTDHTIPLSELKIFIKREVAEKNIDIESGDKIKLSGTIFSNALGDPWFDASSFTMLTKKTKDTKDTKK